MKHNNNFFLYAIGSAFMLVSGAMLLSSPNFDVTLPVSHRASVSTAFEDVQVQEKIVSEGSIEGVVSYIENLQSMPVSNAEVILFSVQDNGVSSVVEQKTFTDENGVYIFQGLSAGMYAVSLTPSSFDVVLPESSVDAFEESRAFFSVPLRFNEQKAGFDFVVDVQKAD